jgi:hypothetical protein
MKDELAERALTEIIGRGTGALNAEVAELQALATVKYDAYGMFKPGVKFLESLAGWLTQFEVADREVALRFVREKLLFISFPEMDHLVELAYPDVIRPWLTTRVIAKKGLPPYAIARAVEDPLFREVERRTLFLGLSDGARLDQLRRAASTMSTEQFHLTYLIDRPLMEERQAPLAAALNRQGSKAAATFSQLVLVDDFAGSGTSMLKQKGADWGGKLNRLKDRLAEVSDFFTEDMQVLIVLYVATAQARDHLADLMPKCGLGDWVVQVVLPLRADVRVTTSFPAIVPLCQKYYDDQLEDPEHTGPVSLGYEGCELPLVLHHNTPNNSISLLWGDTYGQEGARPMRALFPRYARHHKDRP